MASHIRRDPIALAARAFDALANPHIIAAAVRDEAGACVDFEMLAANRAAREVPGLADGDYVGTRLSTSPHRHHLIDLATILAQVVESGETLSALERPILVGLDGPARYFDFTIVSLGEDALCLGWQDVTDQHHAHESALSMDAAAIGMALVSSEMVLVRVNEAMCHMLGYTRNELEGKHVADITHPDDVEIGLLGIRDLIAGDRREFRQRKRYLARSGEVIWADLSAAVVRHADGTVLHLVAQLVNVTAEVAAFEAMQEAVARFRSLAENASDIVAELDLRGRIRWLSPSIKSVLGWDPELLVGSAIVNLLDPADAEPAREVGPRLLRGDVVGSVLLRFRAVDGATRDFDVAAHRVEEAGRPVGMVVGMHDVTDREQAFKALAESEVGCVKFFGQVLWCFQAAVAVLWWSARACAGVR